MLKRFTYAILWVLPVLAIVVYIISLRMQAMFIDRVAVNVSTQDNSLSGIDQAIVEQASYVLGNQVIKEQIMRASETLRSDDFYLDKYEVTQREYRTFLSWYALRGEEANKYRHISQPEAHQFLNPYASHPILGKLRIPAAGVSFYEAYAYCSAAGGALPDRAQWFAAAAGKENRSYPWGEIYIGSSWRYSDPLLNLAASAQQRKPNSSPDGVYDLGSGLSEWTLEETEDNRRVLRGGNSYNRPYVIHALNFIERPAPPSFRSKYTGFRCAYPASSKDEKQSVRNLPWGGDSQVIRILGGDYFAGVSPRHYAPKLLRWSEEINPTVLKSYLSARPTQEGDIQFSKYEISRAEYRSFLIDPFVRLGFYANKDQPRRHSYVPLNWKEQIRQPNLPVVGVDWWSAYAFARWAGGRLPTEREWLYAFRGSARKPYPWGDAYQAGAAHVRDLQSNYKPKTPLPIRQALEDETDSGLIAMAGNISEWTSSVTPDIGSVKMIVKGGNYRLPGQRSAYYGYNAKVPLNHKSGVIGIRVVFN